VAGAAFVLVGPGHLEIARLRDLLTSLWRHEAGIGWVLLVDDEPGRLGRLTFDAPATFRAEGYLDDPLVWLAAWFADDILFGLLVRGVGLRHADCSAPGRPFAVS